MHQPREGGSLQKKIPLFPFIKVHPQDAAQHARLSLSEFWFGRTFSGCRFAADFMPLLWLTTRFISTCPYRSGATSLALELSPELRWPSADSPTSDVRPALKFAHLLNSQLGAGTTFFFRMSAQLIWPSSGPEGTPPAVGSPQLSQHLIQDWSDLYDSSLQLGLLWSGQGTSEASSQVALMLAQSLPLSMRALGKLKGSAVADWKLMSAQYRARFGQQLQWQWGVGLGIHIVAIEWIELAGLLPTVHLAYDFAEES